jgi:hypothetical protein
VRRRDVCGRFRHPRDCGGTLWLRAVTHSVPRTIARARYNASVKPRCCLRAEQFAGAYLPRGACRRRDLSRAGLERRPGRKARKEIARNGTRRSKGRTPGTCRAHCPAMVQQHAVCIVEVCRKALARDWRIWPRAAIQDVQAGRPRVLR